MTLAEKKYGQPQINHLDALENWQEETIIAEPKLITW